VSELDSIDALLDLYERRGAAHYGEGVSQLAHALQAASLAVDEGADDELVCAALLHDVGHLTGDPDAATELDDHHERIGSRLLARVLGSRVAGPVALHVVAKRWRCATDPRYAASLSAASIASLRAQGGPLSAEGCARFEANPTFADAVLLRSWDDRAKVAGAVVPSLASYEPVLRAVAKDASGNA
jgi:phosphonate degradation associated HDIG domain protein